MKRSIKILALLTVLFLAPLMQSCNLLGGGEECTGCDSDTPWSTPESDYCWADRSECTSDNGETCVSCI